jgi:hypothetical protein
MIITKLLTIVSIRMPLASLVTTWLDRDTKKEFHHDFKGCFFILILQAAISLFVVSFEGNLS